MPNSHSSSLGRFLIALTGATLFLFAGARRVYAQADTGANNPAYFKETHFAPRDTISAAAYQGWKQFELNCSRCHGEYGVGTSFAPALVVSLKNGGTIPDEQTFIQTVCAGRPPKGMPSWCALGLEIPKMQMIYAYLKGRADGKIGAGRPALRPDSAAGKS